MFHLSVSSSPDLCYGNLESGNQIMRCKDIVWHIQKGIYPIKGGLERKDLVYEASFSFFFYQIKWSMLTFTENLNLEYSLTCDF